MTGYLSDRQRVEAHIIPMMLLGVLIAGVADKDCPDYAQAQRALIAASEESVAGLDERARSKIIRRSFRVHEELAAKYEGARADKIGLTYFWLIRAITDSDYMVIGDGPMREGVDLFLGSIEHAAVVDPLMASARKQARKLLRSLQDDGYFRGVPFVDEVRAA